jgi:hypothetical protein
MIFIKIYSTEVTISPNRETLQYNDKTLTILKNSLKDIAQTFEKACEVLLKRTTTVIDRHLILKYLDMNRASIPEQIYEQRPFNLYTKSELLNLYFGVRLTKLLLQKNKLNTFKSIQLGQPFKSYFPGLSLNSISFQESHKNASGVRNIHEGPLEIPINFFSSEGYLLDIPKRQPPRERSHYRKKQKQMFLIMPDSTLWDYPKFSLELKSIHRKRYINIKKSLGKLKEYGIDTYLPYSSLPIDTTVSVSKEKREVASFPIKVMRNGAVSSSSYEIEELRVDSLKLKYTANPLMFSNLLYIPLDDLRDTKSISKSFNVYLALFIAHLRKAEITFILINKKKESIVKDKILSISKYIESISKVEKDTLGNSYRHREFTPNIKYISNIEFSTKKYKEAWEAYSSKHGTYEKIVEKNCYFFSHFDEEIKSYVGEGYTLHKTMPVLYEILENFPFIKIIPYSSNIQKSQISTYIKAMEKFLAENEGVNDE